VDTPTDKLLAGLNLPLTREEAERICAQGPEVVVMVLMALSGQAAKGQASAPGPNTPSGAIPPHDKPAKGKGKRKGKPGGKPGHPGRRRSKPPHLTRRVKHPPLKQCPHCGSSVCKTKRERTRYTEDVPDVAPEVTEHTIPQHWCPGCKKHVEPVVDEAMPNATFGHRLVVLTAWLHYGLGQTLSHVVALLQIYLHFRSTPGGLMNAWRRLGEVLWPWYEQIGQAVKDSAVLFADETGWRVAAVTHWLWCFTSPRATYYMIDRSRGSPALKRFFTETFDGVLVTDFWAAYNAVACADRQMCLAHLLREFESVDDRDDSPAWNTFSKKVKRLLRDGLRLKAQSGLSAQVYQRRVHRLHERLMALLECKSDHADVCRLLKRLRRYQDFLFAFLDYDEVPADNNHAEREIRPAVIMRKNCLCNRSDAGANTQAILMSVYRTLKRRGLDPLSTIVNALKAYVRTGELPPLPEGDVVLG